MELKKNKDMKTRVLFSMVIVALLASSCAIGTTVYYDDVYAPSTHAQYQPQPKPQPQPAQSSQPNYSQNYNQGNYQSGYDNQGYYDEAIMMRIMNNTAILMIMGIPTSTTITITTMMTAVTSMTIITLHV